MNFRLASSIYSKHWLIDSQTALAYLHTLEQGTLNKVRGGWSDDEDSKKPKTIFQKLFTSRNSVSVAPITVWDAEDHPGYEGSTIGILPVIGPMMKEDFCGWYGTANLKNELNLMSATESIKAIVMLMDTPGGTVDGTEAFADAYRNSPKEKITVIDGMMCSAGYWAGSPGDEIVATSGTDIIGSIGTMVAFYDYTKAYEEMGIVLREYTATDSHDKNLAFNEAKKGKGKLLIETMLDPMNDVFLNAVRKNRAGKIDEKETLTGKTFIGQGAVTVGLADKVESMDSVLGRLWAKHGKNSNVKISI